jgi:hypothetical protein
MIRMRNETSRSGNNDLSTSCTNTSGWKTLLFMNLPVLNLTVARAVKGGLAFGTFSLGIVATSSTWTRRFLFRGGRRHDDVK